MAMHSTGGLLGAVLGLASAASWGSGDFSGGLATRRSNVYGVVVVSQAVGLVLLVALALLLREPMPPPGILAWAAAAGVAGTGGLVALYSGLAAGPMGVVAPVAAVITAALPVVFGALFEGLPSAASLAGFGLAFVAVWLVSDSGRGRALRVRDLALPLAAGVGFGFFLILIGHTSDVALFWPLVVARVVSLTALGILALGRRAPMPAAALMPLVALTGVFDTGGNAFYALAAGVGRLDAAAVLGSLYPAATVLLARAILKERISIRQWLGLGVALVAVLLIAS
jgi:drug/metabolite transporter (DMT)-like permease